MKSTHKIKQRILTASILAPIAILSIFILPHFEFALFTTILLSIAGWEWCKLIGLKKVPEQVIYLIGLVLLFFISHTFFAFTALIIAAIWWIFVLYLVQQFPRSKKIWSQHKIIFACMGYLLLVPCWIAVLKLHNLSPSYLLFGLFIIWGTDTGAFLIGLQWGKHKLVPNVSPGKTVEGFVGGIFFAILVSLLGAYIMRLPHEKWPAFIVLAIFVAIASVIGDLFESMIKRYAGVKDSGRWLPGHGGLLDRIDSWTCALPVFALGMLIIGNLK